MSKYMLLMVALLLPVPVSAHDISNYVNLTELHTLSGKVVKAPASQYRYASVPQYSSTIKCGKDQTIEFGSRRLSTNLWGVPERENISQNGNCIFLNNDGSFGWEWNRMEPVAFPSDNFTSPINPSVSTGTDPWGGYSTHSKYLPIRIMNLNSFMTEVRYRYSTLPSSSDSINLAYDIWITDTDNPNQNTPRYEVMIWLNRLNVPMPEDELGEDVSDGYNTYTQYASGNYHAFIINDAPASGVNYQKANPKKLIDYLVAKGNLRNDLWISMISFGNEVWKSSGRIEILDLNMRINNRFI